MGLLWLKGVLPERTSKEREKAAAAAAAAAALAAIETDEQGFPPPPQYVPGTRAAFMDQLLQVGTWFAARERTASKLSPRRFHILVLCNTGAWIRLELWATQCPCEAHAKGLCLPSCR